MITDGARPDPGEPAGLIVNHLPVYADEEGMRWLLVGVDQFIPLNSQLVHAIVGKWRAVTRSDAELEVGPLHLMRVTGRPE